MIIPVIMCGGKGTRLWPISRSMFPKQFVDIGDGISLFGKTLSRLSKLFKENYKPIIVTNSKYLPHVKNELIKNSTDATIIIEPSSKNTAAAIASAALYAEEHYDNAVLFITPSDHLINEDSFDELYRSTNNAINLAGKGYIVTLGITPTSPETGFGYIECGTKLACGGFEINKFIEKPNRDNAISLIENGNVYWNAGFFVSCPTTIIKAFRNCCPNVINNIRLLGASEELVISESEFELVPEISFDYAIMEKFDKGAIIPLNITWDDLGSWSSVHKNAPKDIDNNVIQGDVYLSSVNNCLIRSTHRVIGAVGVENLAIVETDDAILVSSLKGSQDVKKIVDKMKKDKRTEIEFCSKVLRPWGFYQTISSGSRFKVKKIEVNPGEQLSLQKHYHRAEHWTVVNGTAEVTLDEQIFLLTENQSTYISAGQIHRLKNPGRIPLVLIEVQTGAYLDEDDIVRIEDKYNRK